MGRGSKKKQGGAGSSAVAPAAAPAGTPPPAAADPIPDDEPVWRLLLGELWQAPERQVVCRLLCCSRAMARLVHELCAGRVVVRISRRPEVTSAQAGGASTPAWQQEVTAHGAAYSAWLAKHARLLAALQLELWEQQEQHVTGLAAAAGVGAAQRTTRAQAASQSAATRAAAAAAAAGPAAASAQPQPLPLRSLSLCSSNSWGSTSGMRLLPSLAAACLQLTRLQLDGSVVAPGQQQQLATAFSALRGLRELSWELPDHLSLRTLQLSTQLTKLRLVRVQLSATAFRSLPASLVDLAYQPECGPLPAAAHLTALTRLACYELNAGSRVRPSVQPLELRQLIDPSPLHALTRLRSLDCASGHVPDCDPGPVQCSLEQLQAAVSAIGPSLTSLDLHVVHFGDSDGSGLDCALLSQRVDRPSLALTGLTVECVETSVAHLGQWTGLTRLALLHTQPTDTPQQVAQQLQQLTALRELKMIAVGCVTMRSGMQPLVDAVVGLTSLRSLFFRGNLQAQQFAQLQGMTQLTKLKW